MKATETTTTTTEAAPGDWGTVPPVPDAIVAGLAGMVEAVERRTLERVICSREKVQAEQKAKAARIDTNAIEDVVRNLNGVALLIGRLGEDDSVNPDEAEVLSDLARSLARKLKAALPAEDAP